MLQNINENIFQFFNQFAQNETVVFFIGYLADAPIFFLPLFLIFMWLKHRKKDTEKENLLTLFYSTVLVIIFSYTTKLFFDVSRPEASMEGVKTLIFEKVPHDSFPSDHAGVSVAFLVALYLTGYKKIFWIFLPFVIIMNLGRIIAGVHWPFDILAGSVLGIIAAFVVCKYISKKNFIKKINSLMLQFAGYFKL